MGVRLTMWSRGVRVLTLLGQGGEALRAVGLGDAHVQHELPATQPHLQHEHEGHYAVLQAAPPPQQQTYEAPQFAMAFAPAPEVAEYQYQVRPCSVTPPMYVVVRRSLYCSAAIITRC
jgi:hypothetical protein